MIHKINDKQYVISSNGVWLNGSYESERAAKYAFKFSDDDLLNLQNEKNKTNSTITFKDLQDLKKYNKNITQS